MQILKRGNFTYDLYFDRSISKHYTGIVNTLSEKESYVPSSSLKYGIGQRFCFEIVDCIPPHLKTIKRQGRKSLTARLESRKGALLYLGMYNSAEEYVNSQLDKKNRKELFRTTRRLEECFSIEYKTFFGKIKEADHKLLIDNLLQMIEKRFNQRGDYSVELKRRSFYEDYSAELIRNKRAMISAIYANGHPICISFNLLFDNILYGKVTAYDPDFSKFGLGHIGIHRTLLWCYTNNFAIYNLGWGSHNYKKKWTNREFIYGCEILAKNIPVVGVIGLNLIKQVLLLRRRHKRLFRFDPTKKNDSNFHYREGYKKEIIEKQQLGDNFNEIGIDFWNNTYLRKPIVDILFSTSSNLGDIKIFKHKKKLVQYVVKANENYILITLNNKDSENDE